MTVNKNNIPVVQQKVKSKRQRNFEVKNFVELLHKNFTKYTEYCELTKTNPDGTNEYILIPTDQLYSIPLEERSKYKVTSTFKREVLG